MLYCVLQNSCEFLGVVSRIAGIALSTETALEGPLRIKIRHILYQNDAEFLLINDIDK